MGRTTSWKDEFTLLCERCGYVVEGLDVGGACPECGKGISESLPERRVGTPWQQSRSSMSLLSTAFLTLNHPISVLSILRPDRVADRRLRRRYILLAGLLQVLPLISLYLHHELNGVYVSFQGVAIFLAIALIPALYACTFVETRGLMFLSSRHGFRIGSMYARSITAHACVGWVVGSLGTAVIVAINLILMALGVTHATPSILTLLLVLLCLVSGFLFFETFAWLGLRRCKYANRARAGGVEGGESSTPAS